MIKKVDIEIVNEKVDKSIDNISSVEFAESDDMEEKKEKIIEYIKIQKSIGKKVN